MRKPSRNYTLLTHSYPRYDGDFAGNFVKLFAESALQLDLYPIVIAPSSPTTITKENKNGITIRRFRYFIKRYEDLAYHGDMHERVKSLIGFIKFWAFLKWFFFYALYYTIKYRSRFIHCHWWIPSGVVGYFVSILTGKPLFISIHGTDLRIITNKGIVGFLMRRVFNRCTKITVASEYLKNRLLEFVPFVKGKIVVFPTPLEPVYFMKKVIADKREFGRILIVARLSKQKNIECAINAMRILLDTNLYVRLKIIGSGENLFELKSLVEELNIQESVEFTGSMTTQEILPQYDNAWLLVLPSMKEGFGLVVAEAQARGLPVIVSNSGGIPGLIDEGNTGYTFDPNKPSELAEIVKQLYNDEQDWNRLSDNAIQWAKGKFSPEYTIELLKGVYETVI